jgi:hypothetical protein
MLNLIPGILASDAPPSAHLDVGTTLARSSSTNLQLWDGSVLHLALLRLRPSGEVFPRGLRLSPALSSLQSVPTRCEGNGRCLGIMERLQLRFRNGAKPRALTEVMSIPCDTDFSVPMARSTSANREQRLENCHQKGVPFLSPTNAVTRARMRHWRRSGSIGSHIQERNSPRLRIVVVIS